MLFSFKKNPKPNPDIASILVCGPDQDIFAYVPSIKLCTYWYDCMNVHHYSPTQSL